MACGKDTLAQHLKSRNGEEEGDGPAIPVVPPVIMARRPCSDRISVWESALFAWLT